MTVHDAPPLASALVRRLLLTHLAAALVLFVASCALVAGIDVMRFLETSESALGRDLEGARGAIAREVLTGDALGRQAVTSHFRARLGLSELRIVEAGGERACGARLSRLSWAPGGGLSFRACARAPLSEYAADRVLEFHRVATHSAGASGILLVGGHAVTFVVSALLLLVSLRGALSRWFVEPLGDLARYLGEKASRVWRASPEAPIAPALAPTSEFRGLLRALEGIEETFLRERREHEALQEERVVFRTLQEEALMLAHDLRQPSLAAAAFVALLEEAPDAAAVRGIVAAHAPKVKDALERLDRGLEDLLALGAPRVSREERVPLRALVDEASRGVGRFGAGWSGDPGRDVGGEGHEESVVNGVDPGLAVLGDRERLGRVLWNLLKNAAQAQADASPGRAPPIIVRAGMAPSDGTGRGGVWIAVENHGRSIPPTVAERLFEPFRSFGPHKGTGLGLSIVRRFVRQHGGEVRLAADGADGGPVRFLVEGLTEAPLSSPEVHAASKAGPSAEAAPRSMGVVEALPTVPARDAAYDGRVEPAAGGASAGSEGEPTPKDTPGSRRERHGATADSGARARRFVLVEDNAVFRQAWRNILDSRGEILAFSRTDEARAYMESLDGDERDETVVIADLVLETHDASGACVGAADAVAFLRWLRPRTRGVIVVCTGLEGEALEGLLPAGISRVRKSLPAMRAFAQGV